MAKVWTRILKGVNGRKRILSEGDVNKEEKEEKEVSQYFL